MENKRKWFELSGAFLGGITASVIFMLSLSPLLDLHTKTRELETKAATLELTIKSRAYSH